MTSIGSLFRIFGAAILLIVVQFASIAAEAHVGRSHGSDGHSLQGHGAAADTANSSSSAEAGSLPADAQAQPATQTQPATVKNGRAAPSGSTACVIGCCGTGTGCCGAALVDVSPDLPPKACALRMGFARPIFVREVDPQGLRKPPRRFA
jgi:hypothetical protein